MRKIQEAELDNKKVLIRADFNVPIDGGKVQEKFKLEACKETVEYIISQEGSKIAICSHLGRPEGKKDPELSLQKLKPDLEKILQQKIIFIKAEKNKKYSSFLI